MNTERLYTWSDLQRWLGSPKWKEQHEGTPRFAFRGQAASPWPLQTSLARHFNGRIAPNEWRKRELKMYQIFRERLLYLCPGVYEAWEPLDILALMQHHSAPTRMLDFTFRPDVAAHFALKDAQGESAIWIMDRVSLEKRRKAKDLPENGFCGPTHKPNYVVFQQDKEKKYRLVGSILEARPNDRSAAQSGCFFVPGSISRTVGEEFVHTKVILSEWLAVESLACLRSLGLSCRRLFPNLEMLATEVQRFSVTGSADYPCTGR